MRIEKIILLMVLSVSISCKSDPKEMAKLNFTSNVLVNNPTSHNYDIDQINEVLIFVTKDLKGVFSEQKLLLKSVNSYRLNHEESGDFLRSLNLLISGGNSCYSRKDESLSFHVIFIGKSKDVLGQFQITKPIGCPDKGFIVTPGAVLELESWKSFENLIGAL
jgi:hypothetical protein